VNVNLRDFPDDIYKTLKVRAIQMGIPFHQYIISVLAVEAEEINSLIYLKRKREMAEVER
jgi:hypothetical protein